MNLSAQEIKIFEKLNTPLKIQDYLDGLKINFEPKGDTCFSPRTVMKNRRAHCIEAALFAYAVMLYHRQKPFLLDFKPITRIMITLFVYSSKMASGALLANQITQL